MELEISPGPEPAERAAVERAVADVLEREAQDPLARSAWWRAGVREHVEPDA